MEKINKTNSQNLLPNKTRTQLALDIERSCNIFKEGIRSMQKSKHSLVSKKSALNTASCEKLYATMEANLSYSNVPPKPQMPVVGKNVTPLWAPKYPIFTLPSKTKSEMALDIERSCNIFRESVRIMQKNSKSLELKKSPIHTASCEEVYAHLEGNSSYNKPTPKPFTTGFWKTKNTTFSQRNKTYSEKVLEQVQKRQLSENRKAVKQNASIFKASFEKVHSKWEGNKLTQNLVMPGINENMPTMFEARNTSLVFPNKTDSERALEQTRQLFRELAESSMEVKNNSAITTSSANLEASMSCSNVSPKALIPDFSKNMPMFCEAKNTAVAFPKKTDSENDLDIERRRTFFQEFAQNNKKSKNFTKKNTPMPAVSGAKRYIDLTANGKNMPINWKASNVELPSSFSGASAQCPLISKIMVNAALRSGRKSSKGATTYQAIKKYISDKYGLSMSDIENNKPTIRQYIEEAEQKNMIIRISGRGLLGSFRILDKKSKPKFKNQKVVKKKSPVPKRKNKK